MRRLTGASLRVALPLLAASAAPARAQEGPGRPITLIVVFAPGGATDALARVSRGRRPLASLHG